MIRFYKVALTLRLFLVALTLVGIFSAVPASAGTTTAAAPAKTTTATAVTTTTPTTAAAAPTTNKTAISTAATSAATTIITTTTTTSVGAGAVVAPKTTEPSQAVWQKLLTRYLDTTAADKVNRVRYSSVTRKDKAALRSYLKSMQAVKPASLNDKGRQAYWINLYNAQTVACILDAWPLKSIRDIKYPGSTSQGPWDAKLIKVDGRELSLNEIENKILRVEWQDNRIHFALNCASIGCPNLSARAFTGANLEGQLEKGAKDFMTSLRGVDITGPNVKISSIFDWYKVDFGKNEKEILGTLAKYATPEASTRLKSYTGKLEHQYDWNLNSK